MYAAKHWLTRLWYGWVVGALVLVAFAVAPERADAAPQFNACNAVGLGRVGWVGGNGNDTWHGTLLTDRALGRWGNDSIFGGGGDDHLCGEGDKDIVGGQDGNDGVYGGWGNDVLTGGAGNDTLNGSLNRDQIHGDAGNDRLFGSGRDLGLLWDRYDHDEEPDFLYGGLGDDKIWAWNGDQVSAGLGNDVIYLHDGHPQGAAPRVSGSPPNRIDCGAGTDTVYGYDPATGDTVVGCENLRPLP